MAVRTQDIKAAMCEAINLFLFPEEEYVKRAKGRS